MVFLTADTHGDLEYFQSKEAKQLKIGDTLIVLGDFGFIWNDDKAEHKVLKKLSKLPCKILFIDGISENFEILNNYPDTIYNQAKAKEIVPNKIYYIKRGEILNLESKTFLCFGGGESDDVDLWINDNSPTEEDFKNCISNLEKNNYKVDYILTHSPSGAIARFLNLKSHISNPLYDFFDYVNSNTQYKRWYFGYYHLNKYVSPKSQGIYSGFHQVKE